MKLSNKEVTSTRAKYTIRADADELNSYREVVASNLTASVKVPGFRPGKAPTDMILKHADQETLQSEFLNLAINNLYAASQAEIDLKIVGEPKISITKFVPYTTLEVSVEVPMVKDIKLPNYKSLKVAKPKASVPKDSVDKNLRELQIRAATIKPVKRPAKKGDLVVTDFEATDPKTKQKLLPASAKDYKILLGEGTLIPGFEEKLVGLKIADTKDFDLTFPKEYADKAFAGRKVHFKATIKDISSVDLPKLDNSFAKTVGPFSTIDQLKDELTKQLGAETERQATVEYENQLLNKIAEETVVEIDDELIESERNFLLENAKKEALNRAQTWKEFLESVGQSEDHYLGQLKKVSIIRIKGGLAIGEIALREDITVTDNELNNEITNLKARYTDPQMQAQLDDPNNRREIRMRLLTEKVLDFIQNTQARTA